MIIQNNCKTAFTASKIPLQDADWVCRKVKTAFPAISPNRLFFENPALIISNSKFNSFISKKGNLLVQDRNDRKFLSSPFKILKEIISSASEHKVAHCNEFASLAEMIARINGVKNCYRLFMENYDHTFLFICEKPIEEGFCKKNNFIIDPWLGISGRVEDILMKYKNVYGKIFQFAQNEKISLKIKKPLSLNENEIKYFREKYPNLVFNSSDGHKLLSFF